MTRSERNEDGFTLRGFIRRTRSYLRSEHPQIVVWRGSWDGVCEDFWWFGFIPEQAAEAIAEIEGFEPPVKSGLARTPLDVYNLANRRMKAQG